MKMKGVTPLLLVACLAALSANSDAVSETKVVCYYTNWSVYRPGTAKFNPQNINPYLCTHLIYAFGGFTKENTLKPFDKYQDIEKGGYAKFTGLKTYNPNLKTMIAIGGWNEGSSRFSSLVDSRERRREFVKNTIKFLRQNKFDGLDLDWEYPAFRDGGKPKDRDNYARLVQELREEYEKEAEATGRPRLLLTMAVPAGIEYVNKGYDIPKLNRYLDWMNILSYDYHSAFEPSVNHHAPLYPLEAKSEYNFEGDLNIDHTIEHYLEAGAEREKLVLGIPTYGRSFTLFNPESNAIGAPADGPGEQGDATREKGYLAYYEICEKLLEKPRTKRDTDDEEEYEDEEDVWTVVQPNPDAMGPYAYKGNQWVGYDDLDIVKKKSEYVAQKGLGGIMFWSIDNDDFRGKCHGKPYPLIEAAKEALYKSLGLTDKVIVSKKPQTTRKRPRPSKPVKSESEDQQDISKNTVRNSKKRPSTESSATTKSSRRRPQSTTESTVVSTPDWGLNTPEPPTTPDPGSDFKCEEEGFFPHPRDCKKYFWCLESGPSNLGIVAHQFTCPSGLYFNKAADSCDFARNVLCNKKKATTTTAAPVTKSITTAPSTTTTSRYTTTQGSRISPQLSALFTTRRPLPKITAATSSTTLQKTTTAPTVEEEYDEEEDEDEVAPGLEEDPKVIKELVDLIKKLGGVEQLEKYLASSGKGKESSIYERVLSKTRSKEELFYSAPPQQNSRGSQLAGLIKEQSESKQRDRPKYTTITRQRQSTTTEEAIEEDDEEPEVTSQSTPLITRSGIPQYVNIRRGRPSTSQPETTARNALFERESEEISSDDENEDKNDVREYQSIRRVRPESTNEVTTSKYKTIQRSRSTTTEANNPSEIPSQTTPSQAQYVTLNRVKTVAPEIIETTTFYSVENSVGDDVNSEIVSPSFASENGIIKNAQITTLSNSPKSNDESTVSPVTGVQYSTQVTISEDPNTSTQKIPFVKRTRPTTTTTPKPQETTELNNKDSTSGKNKPHFFPRRQRLTTTTTTSTTTEAPTKQSDNHRFSSSGVVRRRPSLLDRRKSAGIVTGTSTGTSVQGNVSGKTDSPAIVTTTTSTQRPPRPTRNFLRNYSQRSGSKFTMPTTETVPITSTQSSRKGFRVGIKRRPVSTTSTELVTEITTISSVNTIPSGESDDQETHSTIQQTQEKNTVDEIKTKIIQKRPLFSKNNQIDEQDETEGFVYRKEIQDRPSPDNIYSSVIKPDHTLVQQEKRYDLPRGDTVTSNESLLEVTPDVAVVAHQLLSAPLPTIPSYVASDQSETDNTEVEHFTRAYLLASSSAPIISPNEYITTERPQNHLKYNFPTKSRRISTTVAPFIVYASSTALPFIQRRKPERQEIFQKVSPAPKHYRTFVDYEYYDDDDVRYVGKAPMQGKVYIHPSGSIECFDQGNFPHPESCTKFISCAKMENNEVYGWEYTCPIGLSFDPVGGICNWSAGLGCKH